MYLICLQVPSMTEAHGSSKCDVISIQQCFCLFQGPKYLFQGLKYPSARGRKVALEISTQRYISDSAIDRYISTIFYLLLLLAMNHGQSNLFCHDNIDVVILCITVPLPITSLLLLPTSNALLDKICSLAPCPGSLLSALWRQEKVFSVSFSQHTHILHDLLLRKQKIEKETETNLSNLVDSSP